MLYHYPSTAYDPNQGPKAHGHLIGRLTWTTPEAIRSEEYHRAALSRPIRHGCSLTTCRNRAHYVALPVLDLHETGPRSQGSVPQCWDYR